MIIREQEILIMGTFKPTMGTLQVPETGCLVLIMQMILTQHHQRDH